MRHKSQDQHHTQRMVFHRTAWLVMICLSCMFVFGTAWAGPSAEKKRVTLSEEGQPIQPTPEVTATIDKKTAQRLITTGGDSFRISPATVIVAEDGSQVRLHNLKVPCDARILYKTFSGGRVALQVQVLRTSSNANTDLTHETPE